MDTDQNKQVNDTGWTLLVTPDQYDKIEALKECLEAGTIDRADWMRGIERVAGPIPTEAVLAGAERAAFRLQEMLGGPIEGERWVKGWQVPA